MSSKNSDENPGVEKTKQRRTLKVEKQPSTESNHTGQISRQLNSVDSAKATRAFYYEEEEASRREPENDLQLHRNVCSELRQVMSAVCQLKASGDDASGAEIDELKVHGVLQFVSLKKLNRIAHFRSKKVRDATSEAKLKVDQQHLKLQNLLYEVSHLEKEINKCLQFKSKDEEVSLVPVDEFYKEAPSDIAKPNVTRNDPHQLTLARLHWELEQRKRLSSKLKEAAGLKDHIMGDIKSKKEYLDSLQPKLNAILQATKPVQEHLGMPFDMVREQQRTASYLPSALYVLYVQATAYADACDKNLVVNILGDVELARTAEQTAVFVDDDNENDEADELEKPSEIGRHRCSSVHDKTHRLLQKHPLSVCLIITCPGKNQLSVTFSYMTCLNIVTVQVKLSQQETYSTVSGGDLLQADTLLNCLYADDDGSTTPNPANTYISTLGEFSKYVNEVGRAYHWAQSVCGLQFLDDDPQRVSVSVSQCHIAQTIKRLRRRVHDRMSLQKQLAALEQCEVPVPSMCTALYPTKISSHVTQWKRTTYADVVVCPYAVRFVDLGIVKSDGLFFTATIQRGSAVMTAQIMLGADYPNTASLVALSVQWAGVVRTALNDAAVWDMELEVNTFCDELVKPEKCVTSLMLTNQLQRLLMCFDVYLETNQTPSSTTREFIQDRICSRLARGRNRARPYKYNSQLCFFTQRDNY